jgi:hypothetical protein
MSIKAQADPRPVGRAKLLRVVGRQTDIIEQSKWVAPLGRAHEEHGLRGERREPSVPGGYGGYDDAA